MIGTAAFGDQGKDESVCRKILVVRSSLGDFLKVMCASVGFGEALQSDLRK
jgi:ribosomal protein L37E